MKSRSHRLAVSAPPDDWVDESWTVDCVCGVNFDDGEEMVNCDECGVWVHTRCSRYVKSEKLFACDKCKSKNSRNESEETEVAQLLVELPTKTLRMVNANPSFAAPPRRPFRLWTDKPMEERVHVQGVPGGDPALFSGLSSVFSPELWKCTGYVPKKFNSQYREFPRWDEKQDDEKKLDEGNETPADKGAGVLCSLSNENVLPRPPATLGGVETQSEFGVSDRLAPLNVTKKRQGEDIDVGRPQNGVKKDRSFIAPAIIHPGKRKKEDFGTPNDQSGKKMARSVDKEGDKKRGAHTSKSASTLSSDARQRHLHEDRGPKVVKRLKTDTQSIKHGNSRGTMLADPLSNGHRVMDNVGNLKANLPLSRQCSDPLPSVVPRHDSSIEAKPSKENAIQHISVRNEIPSKSVGVASSSEHNGCGSIPIKEEEVGSAIENCDGSGGGSSKTKPLVEGLAIAAPEVEVNRSFQDSNGGISSSTLQHTTKVKSEIDVDNSGGDFSVRSSQSHVKLDSNGTSAGQFPENVKEHKTSADHFSEDDKDDKELKFGVATSSQICDVGKSKVVGDCKKDKDDELPMSQLDSESTIVVRKSSSELKHGAIRAEEPSHLGSTALSASAQPSQRKLMLSVGKLSSTSSTIMVSKSLVSDNCRTANGQNHNLSSRQREMSDCNASSKKDNASTDVSKDEHGRENPRKIVKELPKSSVNSASKMSHSSKLPHASASKRTLPDPKDPVIHSSSKTSSTQNIAAAPGPSECANGLQNESALHVQSKIVASGVPHRGEKINQSSCQSSSKVNHAQPMHPPAPSNSPATLSDEELALLLHQELNSSPRVPRVPRMRHAGSLPQLASPTATSMLMKRTSSSGGKDHGPVSKRKNKDLTKDNSSELDDKIKKVDRVSSLPDRRRHDLAADSLTKEEADNGLAKGLYSLKKSILPVSTTTTSSGPSSSTEVNDQNMRMHSSPKNASDDDTAAVGQPTHRTLPALIAEIMSKGQRMTYEELCNAVLPHWPNLRKHNGERYAYSSHSQAVLDCLRNRSGWARLVDRGPKTNASRKRRKFDAEPQSFESDGTAKDVELKNFESHREEFPKGKRKARKRRRLALQGRGIKDVGRRHKADVLSDDNSGSSSNSSEESMFSEDEIQGGTACPVGSEASASSDEMGTML